MSTTLTEQGKTMAQTVADWKKLAGLYHDQMEDFAKANRKLTEKANRLQRKLDRVRPDKTDQTYINTLVSRLVKANDRVERLEVAIKSHEDLLEWIAIYAAPDERFIKKLTTRRDKISFKLRGTT